MCEIPIIGLGGIAVTAGGLTYYLDTPEGHAALAKAETRGVGPAILAPHEGPPEPGTAEEPTPPPPSGSTCENYTDAMFDELCSKYFKYGQMKMKPSAQLGLTAPNIACNWQNLCKNILDPIRDAGFVFNINSGFRTLAYNRSIGSASTTSDHLTGCAADLSMGNVEKNKLLFKWVGKNVNPDFSQIIFEGNWVHVSYRGRSPAAAAVLVTRTGKPPYQNGGGYSGNLLPPDLKWT